LRELSDAPLVDSLARRAARPGDKIRRTLRERKKQNQMAPPRKPIIGFTVRSAYSLRLRPRSPQIRAIEKIPHPSTRMPHLIKCATPGGPPCASGNLHRTFPRRAGSGAQLI
jgi:hypothetical protein